MMSVLEQAEESIGYHKTQRDRKHLSYIWTGDRDLYIMRRQYPNWLPTKESILQSANSDFYFVILKITSKSLLRGCLT
jgi:hypothetical protein